MVPHCEKIVLFLAITQTAFAQYNPKNPSKYDLEEEEVEELCPMVPGFEEFADIPKRANNQCYRYKWAPDPCTIEKSGRLESEMLHCGHYEMEPCKDDGRSKKDDGLYGFDISWEEAHGLCDNVLKIKKKTQPKFPEPTRMYWHWTFCDNKGPELKPCGKYSMQYYKDDSNFEIHSS